MYVLAIFYYMPNVFIGNFNCSLSRRSPCSDDFVIFEISWNLPEVSTLDLLAYAYIMCSWVKAILVHEACVTVF